MTNWFDALTDRKIFILIISGKLTFVNDQDEKLTVRLSRYDALTDCRLFIWINLVKATVTTVEIPYNSCLEKWNIFILTR
jgi:hypothetical protein